MSDVRIPDGKISRRRVVQGAMWTAPAVLIATALPAAAGSLVNGTMTFATGYSLVRNPGTPATYTFTGLALQHTGGAPITNLSVTITSNVNEELTPVVTGTGWSLGTATANSFVFLYSGSIASGAVTPALGVTFTRANSGTGVAIFGVTATGNTNGGTGNATATIPPPINA